MLARLAEHFDQQVGGAVDHLRLIAEVIRRKHETDQLHHLLDVVQPGGSLHLGEQVQRAGTRPRPGPAPRSPGRDSDPSASFLPRSTPVPRYKAVTFRRRSGPTGLARMTRPAPAGWGARARARGGVCVAMTLTASLPTAAAEVREGREQ